MHPSWATIGYVAIACITIGYVIGELPRMHRIHNHGKWKWEWYWTNWMFGLTYESKAVVISVGPLLIGFDWRGDVLG